MKSNCSHFRPSCLRILLRHCPSGQSSLVAFPATPSDSASPSLPAMCLLAHLSRSVSLHPNLAQIVSTYHAIITTLNFVCLLILFSSCGENGTDESRFYSDDLFIPEGQIVTYQLLKTTVLEPWGCLTCHGPSGSNTWGANDEDIRQTIFNSRGVPTIPGDPTTAPLYARSAGTNPQPMPPNLNPNYLSPGPVDAQGLEYIRRFIEDQSP